MRYYEERERESERERREGDFLTLLRNFSMIILYSIALILLFELSVWVCLFLPVSVAEMVRMAISTDIFNFLILR